MAVEWLNYNKERKCFMVWFDVCITEQLNGVTMTTHCVFEGFWWRVDQESINERWHCTTWRQCTTFATKLTTTHAWSPWWHASDASTDGKEWGCGNVQFTEHESSFAKQWTNGKHCLRCQCEWIKQLIIE